MSSFLFSCENATYAVPGEHAPLFSGHGEILSCSQGWEPGALNLAQACAMRFRTPLIHSEISRLLLDVGKDQQYCWSRFSNSLAEHDQRRLLERYWQSYRSQLHKRIKGDIDRHGCVMHIMVHSDPDQREHVILHTEKGAMLAEDLAKDWVRVLRRDDLRCSHLVGNGESSLGRELTAAYDPALYAQVRLSVHQDFFLTGLPWRWETIKKHLLDTLAISAAKLEAAPQRQTA